MFEGEFTWDKLRLVGPRAESRLRQLRGVSDWVSSRLVHARAGLGTDYA